MTLIYNYTLLMDRDRGLKITRSQPKKFIRQISQGFSFSFIIAIFDIFLKCFKMPFILDNGHPIYWNTIHIFNVCTQDQKSFFKC